MVDWGEEKPNGEFWVNFRQEDRICRKGGEEKAETGDWRPERKGRVTGDGWGKFWILDGRLWIEDDVGFLMEFSIQHLKFKILPWSQGFSEVVLTIEVRIF